VGSLELLHGACQLGLVQRLSRESPAKLDECAASDSLRRTISTQRSREGGAARDRLGAAGETPRQCRLRSTVGGAQRLPLHSNIQHRQSRLRERHRMAPGTRRRCCARRTVGRYRRSCTHSTRPRAARPPGQARTRFAHRRPCRDDGFDPCLPRPGDWQGAFIGQQARMAGRPPADINAPN